jgi:hypothetical protein
MPDCGVRCRFCSCPTAACSRPVWWPVRPC